MAKVTKAQFGQFKRTSEKWLKLFGLSNWEVYFNWEAMDEGTMATAHYDMPNKVAFLTFCKTWDINDIPLTPEEIKATAFHEVCHILFADLHLLAESRYVQNGTVFDEKIHDIIKRLQNFAVEKKLV